MRDRVIRRDVGTGFWFGAVLAFVVGVLVLFWSSGAARAGTANTNEAQAYVNSLTDSIMAVLSDMDTTDKQKEDKFSTIFRSFTDTRRIGLFSLGKYARDLRGEQRDEYFSLLENYLIAIYFGHLNAYRDETLEVNGAIEKGINGKQVIVNGRLHFTDGRPDIGINWWLFKSNDSFKIFDISIEGVWLAQNQRSQFTTVISQNEGDLNALFEHLRKRSNKPPQQVMAQ